jgi:FkbM family methyltransferase
MRNTSNRLVRTASKKLFDLIGFSGRFLAQHHNSRLAAFVDRACVELHRQYENYNYDIDTNGERRVMSLLQKCLHPSVVFDVGANVGDWAFFASQIFRDATIHCFEAIPDTAVALQARFRKEDRVIVNAFGLSDKEERAKFNYYPGASALSSRFFYWERNADTVFVDLVPGDEYIKLSGLSHVDYLKLDVEGSEELVLSGLARSLSSRRISVIQFEYGQMNIISRFLLRDAYHLLLDLGYTIGKIYPNTVTFRDYSFGDEDFIGPNYLAVKHELIDLQSALAANRELS